MDGIIEQIVKRKSDAKMKMIKLLILLAGIIVIIAVDVIIVNSFPGGQILFFLTLLITPILAYVLHKIITNFNLEFEYSVIRSSIEVTKIISKRSRKTVADVYIREFLDFGIYSERNVSGLTYDTKVLAVESLEGPGDERYYAIFKDKNKIEKNITLLVIQPDERVFKAIYSHLPQDFRNKVKKD